MKQPRTSIPTFALFQRAHLIEGARLVWVANVGMHCAGIVRSLIGAVWGDFFSYVAYTCFHALPMWTVSRGHIEWVQGACTTTSICVSLMLWCMGVGWLPEVPGIKLVVGLHLDLVIELVYLLQYQMSLPLVAVLHALRQAGWQSTAVWRLGGSLQSSVARGVCNWLLLMTVAWMVERRLRCQYQKLYPSRQKAPEQQPEASGLRKACWETASEPPGGITDDDGSTHGAMHARQEPAGMALVNLTGTAGPSLAAGAAVMGEPTGDAGSMPRLTSAVMAGRLSATLPPAPTDTFSVPEGKATPPLALRPTGRVTVAGSSGPVSLKAQPCAVLEQLRQFNLAYKRSRPYTGKSVCVKMEGVELEQLPPDLPRLLHEQIRHCMPGVTLSALALRSGCVLMTMDLMCPVDGSGDGAVTLADDTRRLIARLMQDHSMGHVLEDGATMSIQVPAGLSFCRWDSDASTYTSDSVTQTLDALDTATLTNCFLMSAFPAVQCWPDAVQASRQLTLIVELQLPSNCQLHGWQPDGVAAPAAWSGQLSSASQDGPVMDAMLLARRLDGGYLPVVLELGSQGRHGSEEAVSHRVKAKVTVTINGTSAAALRLELWCKVDAGRQEARAAEQPTVAAALRPELLVSHMPLLVLPSSWKEAAAELQQHVKDMGGVQPRHAAPPQHAATETRLAESVASDLPAGQPPVDEPEDATCSLLEDLGTWLTHHQRYPGSSTEQGMVAISDGVISGTGDDLLVYALRAGLGAVAGMIVDTMQRSEQQVPASGSSAWLARVACGSEAPSVLHAAMASGDPDMLAQVLRWGTLYGGPDWAWPWELEDATGCTALHLAAAQPAAGACAALLKTITCMLPAGQVQAARNAWMNCQGGMGVAPAGLLERTSPMSRHVWSREGSSQGTDAAGCSSENRSDSAMSMGSAAAHPLSPPSQITGQDQSCLHSVIAVWRLRETDEYRAWAKEQMPHIRLWWVAVTSIIVAVCMYRSALTGCLQYEYLHISLQGFAYMPLVASTSWGSWQAWLLSPYVLYCLAYKAKVRLPSTCMPLWIAAGTTGAEALFVLVIDAPMDQAALPRILVARSVMAYFQSLAYRALALPFSLPRAILIQLAALVVATVCRARQRRAFQRWQATQVRAAGKRSLQEEGPCAAGTSRKKDESCSKAQEITSQCS